MKYDSEKSKKKTAKRWTVKYFLYVIIFAALSILLLVVLSKPLRTHSANKYAERGDIFLSDKKYLQADLAYEKALAISPGNKRVLQKKDLAQKASENVLVLESFYRDNGLKSQKEKFDLASAFPENETEAVKLSKKLIEEGEYQLAIIPAQTAAEMDPEYRDAWLYLGIANLKTAQSVELKSDAQKKYLDKAKNALNKAKEIDPQYEPIKDFLNQLPK